MFIRTIYSEIYRKVVCYALVSQLERKVLSFTDPSWCLFKANYTDGSHVATLLQQAESGEPIDSWYEDLFQELCHQYTVSESAYPAAPHLLRIAVSRPEIRRDMLVLLGSCHAFSTLPTTESMSKDVLEGWRSSARQAVPVIAGMLAEPQETEEELRYLLFALAAVHGHPNLASGIESLDVETGFPAG
jgi:hypothetical protein